MRAHNPKNGEIWETKSGNIVLIVSSYDTFAELLYDITNQSNLT